MLAKVINFPLRGESLNFNTTIHRPIELDIKINRYRLIQITPRTVSHINLLGLWEDNTDV